MMATLGSWDFRDAARAVQAPVRTIRGSEDNIPLSGCLEWVEVLPNARLLQLDPRRSRMAGLIQFLLENFTLTLLAGGLAASAVSLWRAPKPWPPGAVVEALFSYFILFSIGFGHLYNFVVHVFFGEMTARFIGWADSPFQAEVGFASLGFAVVGFLAFRGGRGLRVAAVVAPSCFLLGAAAGHVIQMVRARNFAPGNAGSSCSTPTS